MSYAPIKAKLARGETIILDGGTGTDIQNRGVPMSEGTWCADANLTHPDVVRAVHADYIKVGADIITANTFATSPLLFSAIGRMDEVPRIDAIAVALAREAAAGTAVAVAGSMSTMRPMQAGSDRNNLAQEWPEQEARALFRRKAQGLKDAGCDFIMMELLRDTDYAVWATEAALETGLPVWIGVSAERDKGGNLQGWGRDDCKLDDIIRKLAALKPDVMCIMHTSPNDTADAIAVLRKHWTGPIGTYPESGYFKAPDWSFENVIAAGPLVDMSRAWQAQGTTIFGGCCGIGPEHIRELKKAFA